MRQISQKEIVETVSGLCLQANFSLRKDVLGALKKACRLETNNLARQMIEAIIKNACIADKEDIAICQDTGLPCIFVEIGQDVRIKGDLKTAINKGIEDGYKKGSFRDSIVKDPLKRGSPGYAGAVIHFDIVKGDKLKITVLPKGFGSENKTQLKMLNPTAGMEGISEFVVKAVKDAGPDACPPYVIGVGIGGSADYACILAKKALIRKLYDSRHRLYVKLEADLLKRINALNIGPMGLGGKTTALAVNVETAPTHIAGLPVCVNISCHALRSASKIL